MKFSVVRRGIAGPIFEESSDPKVREYCRCKKEKSDSLCNQHYDSLFRKMDVQRTPEKRRCPYGLVTTTAFGSFTSPFVLSGFWARSIGDPLAPEEIVEAAAVGDSELSNTLMVLCELANGIHSDELGHFEAAIHDARHLNHAILQNAELVLRDLGWPQDEIWDMQALQRDSMALRVLTIFAASRDLSLSMEMHEISRDPSQAKRDIGPCQIHKLFYRQARISLERANAAGLTITLGATTKELRISRAFRLIPKILIDNAIKYSNRGSEIKILFSESSSLFAIECKNIGPVATDEEIPSLFERGVRGANKKGIEGQGLGLWLAKTIVEANHGLISLETRNVTRDYSGRRMGNTIVTIKLPR